MARILILLPQTDFDPTEVAVPWKAWSEAGHDVVFATETGVPAACDPVTLTGAGLPLLARSLKARAENAALYAEMAACPAFNAPLRWNAVHTGDYDALHFPGGHAPGMKSYCESAEIQRIAREAFAAGQTVSAICHGVLPLARAGVLTGRRTTALTAMMEDVAVALTVRALPGHYRTYPHSVEAEVTAALARPQDFARGPMLPRYATPARPDVGFVVEDGAYCSARWPGDAWTLARAVLRRLA
ncbi:MAG TPA: type 1 glutamine amidotransferase domain-containing protein [Chakrabartia sp.]|jgi:protease I|nr:type 1 glutamine amidotransferase domain-containing protein [Chakrabartia sp.]